MTWGGYYNGLRFYGVTCFTPTGGYVPVPEPSTMLLLCFGLIAIAAGFRRKLNWTILTLRWRQGDHLA